MRCVHASAKYVFSIFLVIATAVAGAAQSKQFEEMEPEMDWSDGSILLTNGEELKGLIRYNDRLGILGYEAGAKSSSYTARSVTAFEFFDRIQNRQRVFYSLEFADNPEEANRPSFFEVLREFRDFAIISRFDNIKFEQQNYTNYGAGGVNGMPAPPMSFKITHATHTETIYFLSGEEIKPYMTITRIIKDKSALQSGKDKFKNKVLDDDLLKKYFKEPGLSKMKEFAEANDLQFDIKEDLLKILDMYDSEH